MAFRPAQRGPEGYDADAEGERVATWQKARRYTQEEVERGRAWTAYIKAQLAGRAPAEQPPRFGQAALELDEPAEP